jgi:hypothetical protein
MARLMFDSDNIADLPDNTLCATYADLVHNPADVDNLRKRFRHGILFIDRHGDPLDIATILDVERGLHGANDVPGWLDHKKSKGITGTVYCNRSSLDAVNAAAGQRQLSRWIATLDGTMHIPNFKAGETPAAVQFATSQMLGFHCDASVVWEDGWHPAPAVWDRSPILLKGLQTVADDVQNCITIVRQHLP